MLDELNSALDTYGKNWKALVDGCNDKTFFEGLEPTAVGWKVADREEYDRICAGLHDLSSHVIETWMNGRWVAKFLLRGTALDNGIRLVKIMQRRPGSDDAAGLDHVDFFGIDVGRAEEVLAAEPGLKWTRESNDIIADYEWISLWFEGTEAKLKSDTVLDIIAAELNEANDGIKAAVK